jgi:hypothetical protein
MKQASFIQLQSIDQVLDSIPILQTLKDLTGGLDVPAKVLP